MDKPTGGRGKKAPYEQTHVRVPLPIKDRVENLKRMFLDGSLEHYEELLEDDYKKARKYENSLTGSNNVSNSEVNSLPNLEEAQAIAKKLLGQKKSARETVAKLLTGLYHIDVNPNDLKD